ncbi:MAG: insulinase family protein, partial [Myxococcales bacterium]|nr:insulinase family protein [Myxococcales bacterium]
ALGAGCQLVGRAAERAPVYGPPFATLPPAWDEAPPEPADAPITEPGALARFALPNGLHAILLSDHRLPHLVVGVALRRGAGAEPPELAGLAAYTAELLERGAGDRDALALATLVDGLGASLGASADWDSMTVTASGLSSDVDTLFEVLRDVVLRPRFDAEEGRKARAETLAGLEQAKDDPATLVGWHAARAAYGDHRYGTPAEGTSETVARLDAAAARRFWERVAIANDAVVFAAGDIDRAAFEARVQSAFGGWRSGDVPPEAPAPPARVPGERKVVVVDEPDLNQARIVLVHEGLARADERRIPAAVMNDILGGGGFSSRLMKSVRSEAGLTYGVWSGFGLRRRPGPFIVETFTQVPRARAALDRVLAELERIATEPPDAAEVAGARTLRVGRFGLGLETSSSVVEALVDLDVHGLPEDGLDTFRGRVRRVDVEEVARMARELVHPERAAIVVLGPASALVPQLEGLGHVEVVAP